MSEIRIYQRQVGAGGTPQLGFANAAAFGAEAGAALAGFGDAAQNNYDRVHEIEKRRAQEDQSTAFASSWATTQGQVQTDLVDARANAAAGGDGHVEQATKIFDTRSADALAAITDPHVRARAAQQVAEARADIVARESAWAAGQRADKLVGDAQATGSTLTNNLEGAPSPKAYGKAIDDYDAMLGGLTGIGGNEKVKLQRGFRSDAAEALIRGFRTADPEHGLQILNSGLVDGELQDGRKAVLADALQNEIDHRTAIARAAAGQAKSEEREAIATGKAQLEAAGTMPLDQVEDLARRAEAIGDTSTAVQLRARGQEIRVTSALRGSSPIALRQRLTALEAKAAPLGASVPPELAIAMQGTRKLLDETEQRVRADPLAAQAWATGKVAPPLDFNDPASQTARSHYANAAAKHWGTPLQYLTADEAAQLGQHARQSPQGQLDVISQIAPLGAGSADAVARQVLPGDFRFRTAVAIATNPDRASGQRNAADAIAGLEDRKTNPKLVPDNQVGPELQKIMPALSDLSPDAIKGITEAAKSIYARRAVRGGVEQFDANLFGQALHDAAGAGHQGGDQVGGFATWRGRATLLPPGWKASDLVGHITHATDADFVHAAGKAFYSDRKTAAGADVIKRGELVATGDFTYHVKVNGAYLAGDGPGGLYQLDVRKLPHR